MRKGWDPCKERSLPPPEGTWKGFTGGHIWAEPEAQKEEKSLSAPKGGKGIPGMLGRGHFVSKTLEAVKGWWVGERAGVMMRLKCRARGWRT